MLKHKPSRTQLKALHMHPIRFLSLLIVSLVLSTAPAVLYADSTGSEPAVAPTAEPTAPASPEAPTSTESPEPASPEATAPEAPTSEGPSADEPAPAEPVVQETQISLIDEPTDETHRNVFNAFRNRFPSLPIESLSDGPYPGLYEIITDSQIIYVDEAMSLLFQGEMIDLNTSVNLTEARLAGIHMGLINELGEQNMLVYKAATPSNRTITVFTDINCGYCRMLHSEIDTLLEGGVNVRYLMFPRAGLESDSRTALESVWCADNPQEAMTAAKAGQPVEEKTCDTPIETHYALAGQVGLRGTPLIYLDNGTAIPGYRKAAELVQMINSSEPMTN